MRKEEEDQQMRQLVQTLQAALEKEKIKVKDLTEQVNTWFNSCKPFPVLPKALLYFVTCMYVTCVFVHFVQVAEAKLEAAHNRRHYRAAMLELSEIKKDLQTKEELIKTLQKEAKTLA